MNPKQIVFTREFDSRPKYSPPRPRNDSVVKQERIRIDREKLDWQKKTDKFFMTLVAAIGAVFVLLLFIALIAR